MRKEKLELEKREYLQPSITMYDTKEETPLLTSSIEPGLKEKDWIDQSGDVDGGEIEL